MRKGPFPATIALALAALVALSTSTAFGAVSIAKKLPKDVCALVSDDQVAPLVPSARSEPTDKTPTSVGCHWEDGSDVPQSLATITVSVLKLPGVPISQLKLSLKVEAKDYDGKIIKRLGKLATQQSVIPPNTEVKVLLKGNRLLSVEFSGDGPVTDDQAAQTLAIAKAVVKKL